MRKTDEAGLALSRRREDATLAWQDLKGALRSDLGWRPSKRWAMLLAAGALGIALGWAWRCRR